MLRAIQVLGRLGLTLTICAILSACAASLQQISSEQRAAIQAENKALVLFRLTARVDQKIVAPLTNSGNFIGIAFDLANLDGGEPARTIIADSSGVLVGLSTDATSHGWPHWRSRRARIISSFAPGATNGFSQRTSPRCNFASRFLAGINQSTSAPSSWIVSSHQFRLGLVRRKGRLHVRGTTRYRSMSRKTRRSCFVTPPTCQLR